MTAIIRFGASLKNLLQKEGEISVEAGRSVKELLPGLGINPDLVAMVSVNGEMQPKDYVIKDGDVIRLMAVIGGG